MLHLLDENFSRIGSFNTHDEVVGFIHNSQIYHLVYVNNRDDYLGGTLDLAEMGWRFVYYRHSELNIIYSCMSEPPIKGIELEAFKQGLDLIEIHHGSPLNPIQIPVTEDLDIESLKKEWCEAYCKAHGYSLIETLKNEGLSESPMTGGSDDLVV
jgi:hypothetical protein